MFVEECIKSSLDQPFIAGIDEAGRGPVIGDMVYSLALEPIDYEWPELLNDSKQLTTQVRQDIFDQLTINYYIVSIPASYISEHMLLGISLNEIALLATTLLLDKIKDLDIKCIYVDTLGHPKHHKIRLEQITQHKVVVESKADTKYKSVMAASICAKVIRDSKIQHGMGSGYPGDPNTISYMKNTHPLFGYESFVRFSWKTTIELTKKYNIQFENEEKLDKKKKIEKGQMKLSFGKPKIVQSNIELSMIHFE